MSVCLSWFNLHIKLSQAAVHVQAAGIIATSSEVTSISYFSERVVSIIHDCIPVLLLISCQTPSMFSWV